MDSGPHKPERPALQGVLNPNLAFRSLPATTQFDLDSPFPERWDTEQLRAARLAAYAYTVHPSGSERRDALLGDYTEAVLSHEAAKRTAIPLLRAWSEAGIQILLFKGFAQAEFVYPTRGVRSYADIDVLVRPDDARPALAIAHSMDWWDSMNVSRDALNHHTVYLLHSPDGKAKLDVHRRVLHSYMPWTRTQCRITAEIWERSVPRMLEGVPIRLPAPVDCAVIGIILQRAWGDNWNVRPDHLLDLQMLREREGVTQSAILDRARVLRCTRTVDTFLGEHSDQHRNSGRGSGTVGRRTGALLLERPDLLMPHWLARLYILGHGVPASLPALLRFARILIRVRRELRLPMEDAEELLSRLKPVSPAPTRLPDESPAWSENALRYSMRLVRPAPHPPGLVRLLALYTTLRTDGWPVEYRMTDRSEGIARSPAWLELHGRVVATSDRSVHAAGRRLRKAAGARQGG